MPKELAEEITELIWRRHKAEWDAFAKISEEEGWRLTEKSRKAFARMDALAGLFMDATEILKKGAETDGAH